jgi:Peptidase C13 family/YcxB-like protein
MQQPDAPLADAPPTPGSAAEPIVIELELTPADWDAWTAAWSAFARARVGSGRLRAALVLPFVLGVLVFTVGRADLRALPPFVAGVGCFYLTAAITQRLYQRINRPDPNGFHLGRMRMELSPEGIRMERTHGSGTTRWPAITRVTRTSTHAFLWIDALTAYIVPLRDLPAGVTADELVARVRALAGSETPFESGVETADAPALGFVGALWRRLLWRALPESGAASSDGVIACCAIVALVVWLAFDRYQAGDGAQWYPGGAAGVAWYAGGLLLVAWVAHRASARSARYRSVLAAMVGAAPVALGLGLSIHEWARPSWRLPCDVLLAVIVILHLHRALAATTGSPKPAALFAAALAASLFGFATEHAWVQPTFWFAGDEEDEGTEDDSVANESLLFEQADRIDDAAGDVAPGRPGRPDVFFLGFAGFGEQKVFAEELKLAQSVVARRYGADGRSLLLVNDTRDRETWPLATVPGLRHALARIAERMDPDEDVLFLMLTSHGSDDPTLSVSNGTLSLSPLDGPELRDALEASGIRWRVIVISACYSGAFIDLLADDRTIVVTSAAADRTSFGCGDDNEVTEFGAAFIRDALPRADSLAAAFETARKAIAEREGAAKLEPSSPQARFGRAIEPYWAKIEAEHTGPAGSR